MIYENYSLKKDFLYLTLLFHLFGPFLSCLMKINGNCYLLSQSFEIWRFIRGIEVGHKYKISAQYLQNYVCSAKKHHYCKLYHYCHVCHLMDGITWYIL